MNLQERWDLSLREEAEADFDEQVLEGAPGYHERRLPDGTVQRAYKPPYCDPRDYYVAEAIDYSNLPDPLTQPPSNRVRENAAAASPLPAVKSGAQPTADGLQQALAVANAGTALCLREDSSSVRETTRAATPDSYAVRSDQDALVHESVGAAIFDYMLPVGVLPCRQVREGAALDHNHGYTNPLRPGLRAALAAANEGVARIFAPRATSTSQQPDAQGIESMVANALFGKNRG